MRGLRRTIVFMVPILMQLHAVALKFDWNFQRVRNKLCIAALFVRNQTVKDFSVGAKSCSGCIANENPLRTGGDRGRIKSTAHKDGRVFRSQPVGDGNVEQLPELLDALVWPFVMERSTHRKLPVAAKGDAALPTCEAV